MIEGVLKFTRPEALGSGRFAKIGIPHAELLAGLDGAFEVGCGALILIGLFSRLAVLPMIVDMFLLIAGAGGLSLDARRVAHL